MRLECLIRVTRKMRVHDEMTHGQEMCSEFWKEAEGARSCRLQKRHVKQKFAFVNRNQLELSPHSFSTTSSLIYKVQVRSTFFLRLANIASVMIPIHTIRFTTFGVTIVLTTPIFQPCLILPFYLHPFFSIR